MRLGQWQSEAFGRYENCTYLNVADCILLKTSTETYAINIESDKSTYALFEAIQKEMAKQYQKTGKIKWKNCELAL